MRHLLYAFIILITLSCGIDNDQKNAYVFPSFTGNGEDGLHLLVGYDGFTWQAVDDFKSYTPRKLFYAPVNHQVIDAFVAKVDDENYVMGIKEEPIPQATWR